MFIMPGAESVWLYVNHLDYVLQSAYWAGLMHTNETVHYELFSLVPRLRDKILEWAGDEATIYWVYGSIKPLPWQL